VPHVFVRCSSCSCLPFVLIRRDFEFWLDEVSDGPQQQADGPRVPGGQSTCSPRTVRFSEFASGGSVGFNGQSAAQAGRSAWPVRTVRLSWPDGPPEPVSFSSWFDSSLPFLCFRVCYRESFLGLEVDP
jgi:hypothetical protein